MVCRHSEGKSRICRVLLVGVIMGETNWLDYHNLLLPRLYSTLGCNRNAQ